jgi:hypothetical protein
MPGALRVRGGGLLGSKKKVTKEKEKRTCEACAYEWSPDEQKPHTLTHCPKCLQEYGAPVREVVKPKAAEPAVNAQAASNPGAGAPAVSEPMLNTSAKSNEPPPAAKDQPVAKPEAEPHGTPDLISGVADGIAKLSDRIFGSTVPGSELPANGPASGSAPAPPATAKEVEALAASLKEVQATLNALRAHLDEQMGQLKRDVAVEVDKVASSITELKGVIGRRAAAREEVRDGAMKQRRRQRTNTSSASPPPAVPHDAAGGNQTGGLAMEGNHEKQEELEERRATSGGAVKERPPRDTSHMPAHNGGGSASISHGMGLNA